jgi:UDP-galactopyranose mutase
MEAYYPINDQKNQNIYNQYVKKYINNKKYIFGGRLGLYQYLNMDQTIEKALNMSKKLIL